MKTPFFRFAWSGFAIVVAVFAALIALPLTRSVHAASCCGGGAGASLVLPKAARYSVLVSTEKEEYTGFYNLDGKYLSNPEGSNLYQTRLNVAAAVRLHSFLQASLAAPFVYNYNHYSGVESVTSGPGDIGVGLLGELFRDIKCVWKVKSWQDLIPAAYLGAGLVIPTGISPYDNVTQSFDITGRGFYRFDVKAMVDKTIYPVSLSLTAAYGSYFSRPVNREYGKYVEPYTKKLGNRIVASGVLSYGWSFLSAASFTLSGSYQYVSEGETRINGRPDPLSSYYKHGAGIAGAYTAPNQNLVVKIKYNRNIFQDAWGENQPATGTLGMEATYVFR